MRAWMLHAIIWVAISLFLSTLLIQRTMRPQAGQSSHSVSNDRRSLAFKYPAVQPSTEQIQKVHEIAELFDVRIDSIETMPNGTMIVFSWTGAGDYIAADFVEDLVQWDLISTYQRFDEGHEEPEYEASTYQMAYLVRFKKQ